MTREVADKKAEGGIDGEGKGDKERVQEADISPCR